MSTTAFILVSGIFRGAIILTCGLIASSFLPRAAASFRHVILCAALSAQVVIPLLTVLAPGQIGAVMPERITSAVVGTESRIADVASPLNWRFRGGAIASSDALTDGQAAVTLWITGFAMVAAWMIYGRLSMKRLVRQLRPTRSGLVFNALNSAADDLEVHRPVTLLEGGSFSAPVTWGTVYPVVLMPGDSAAWTSERLRMAVLHEIAHIARNDSIVHAAARIIAALVWFNPLVWIALRRLRLTAERAADDVVINSGVDPTRYVDTLVDMLKNARSVSPALQGSFAMARRSDFETRMMSVLDENIPRGRIGNGRFVALTFAFASISMLVAAVPSRVAIAPGAILSPATVGDGSLWIKAASDSRGDVERFNFLKKAINTGYMTSSDIDAYLDVVAKMTNPIPTGQSLVALAAINIQNNHQYSRMLSLATNIDASVPRAAALDAVTRVNRP